MIKIGDKIDGRYRIVSRVATGGMADVYEAFGGFVVIDDLYEN